MKKKKIFFVMPNLGGGGGERVISILLNNIDREKYSPSLVILKESGSNAFLKDLKKDISIHFLGIKTRIKISFPLVIFKLIQLSKKEQPDILFFGSGQINALLSPFIPLFPKHIKFIARESNLPSLFEKYFVIKFLYKKCYVNYDSVIVQSDDMLNDLNLNFHIPQTKLIKINNPVDVLHIEKKLLEKPHTHEKAQDNFNILVAGRLTYQKGFDLLIEELAKLKNIAYKLTILGDGEEKENLIALLNKYNLTNKICFKGAVDNPYTFMKAADLFILSSRFEGFPNVVLESLVCGTPVLANNCLGGINEIIKPGINGEIFSFEKLDFQEKFEKIINTKYDSVQISTDTKNRFSVNHKMKEFHRVIEM
ncbi:Glycosyltransferase involved in cell wall bisynthesis [Algibacter luteus]|uniref:Glycosyltransferase involved in cell wall bisynthesis n=2 Tax=Algibacter luteus TaxID=1178825 RepID=A0A1M6DAT5_9FLAO|nr:Glycosyltransferase involved in cell wall bisynthesis [Algibacter luteus]